MLKSLFTILAFEWFLSLMNCCIMTSKWISLFPLEFKKCVSAILVLHVVKMALQIPHWNGFFDSWTFFLYIFTKLIVPTFTWRITSKMLYTLIRHFWCDLLGFFAVSLKSGTPLQFLIWTVLFTLYKRTGPGHLTILKFFHYPINLIFHVSLITSCSL